MESRIAQEYLHHLKSQIKNQSTHAAEISSSTMFRKSQPPGRLLSIIPWEGAAEDKAELKLFHEMATTAESKTLSNGEH
jgi:hypothetical protein